MIVNNIDISLKLLEFIFPLVEPYGITDAKPIKEICDKLVDKKPNLMIQVASSNIIKNELFDTMSEISKFIKIELLNIPEFEKVSLKEFNELCSKIPKAIVSFSIACSKIHYHFFVDINEHNEEFIEIRKKDESVCMHKLTGTVFRKFISDIILALNNSAYISPLSSVIINIETYDNKKRKCDIALDLEDMIIIMNLYTITINAKFNKAANKSFTINIDPLDTMADNSGIKPVLNYQNRKEEQIIVAGNVGYIVDEEGFVKLSEVMPDWKENRGDSL